MPNGQDSVTHQPEWIAANQEMLCKKPSSVQFGVGVEFPATCDKALSLEVPDHFAEKSLGLRPVLDLAAPHTNDG